MEPAQILHFPLGPINSNPVIAFRILPRDHSFRSQLVCVVASECVNPSHQIVVQAHDEEPSHEILPTAVI